MKAPLLDALLSARRARRPIVLVTDLRSGAQVLVDGQHDPIPQILSEETLTAAYQALEKNCSSLLETPDGSFLLHAFNPPLRLIIVGAVHITQSLAPMAELAGYDVTILDPRRSFASSSRFPQGRLVTRWPHEALPELALDERTAIVTLTHDPKLDDPALHAALHAPVFYIGSLGSRKTQAARLKRLARAGFSEAMLGRIHGPVGLPLGGRSPSDIAISILAEMTQVLHGNM